ncbi:glutathione S-transferase family protein [Bradyrhizobium sp. Pear76]|uniref:glutathione S-transferase family protein n=1 Tax=Bradyrhizobium oropedii TaxID=1571201 RepID=UPI001E4D5B8B|nr:glutathione S-transferase family protein [Bradyrhizobium oropedii]MCC8968168.1 glutathione S-transferase family protein [Bradyrhizobium oropedii]
MSLTLHYHPLSSFCWKALVALYENGATFTPNMVNLGDPAERAALLALSPIGRFPLLRDETRGETVPESSIVIEYLDRHYPGTVRLIPDDSELALQTRLRDRFVDLYVHLPTQKIVGDRLRPADRRDPHGVAVARAELRSSYAILDQQLLILDRQLARRGWMMGEQFSLADCAAAPALFYGNKVEPIGEGHRHLAAYLERLKVRPSFARVLKEAEPYFGMFPQEG